MTVKFHYAVNEHVYTTHVINSSSKKRKKRSNTFASDFLMQMLVTELLVTYLSKFILDAVTHLVMS